MPCNATSQAHQPGIVAKIVEAYRQGILGAKLVRESRRFWRILRSARYAVHNPARGLITLHCPDYVQPEVADYGLVERVFCAFKAMKKDQPSQPACYAPAPMWQTFLDQAYANLTEGARTGDLDRFHFFLANFGTWKQYTAVESSVLIRDHMTSFLRQEYLRNDIFHKQFTFWRWFYNHRKSLSALSYPLHGNQSGAYVNGVFVGVGSFFNEIYGSLLSEVVRTESRPVVAELGAGYGKFAYFTLRNLYHFVYLDFDLPETLCLASYYLMKAFPDKRVLLYGEEPYTTATHARYDLIFMPPWEMAKAGERTVDLFINKNSLGEMDKNSVNAYLRGIARATRYFFHLNHDVVPARIGDHQVGLLAHEYPVPADQFRLLLRYPDLGHLLFHEGEADFGMDIFLYLYERLDLTCRSVKA